MEAGAGSVRRWESGRVMAKDEDEMVKWQRWERGGQRRRYKASFSPFWIRGFLGNRSRDLRVSGFSDAAKWAVMWAFAQPQPMSLIYRCHWLLLTD